MRSYRRKEERPWQEGVTGLETAIVLIAFVVVSSVFAFAALSTGLFSADKSKETIQEGLGEAQGTLEVKAGVQINASSTGNLTNQTGITTGGTAFTLSKTPVIPGSETITVDSSVLTLGPDYTINYDTGAVTLTTAIVNANNDITTADYTQYGIDSVDVNLANAAGGGTGGPEPWGDADIVPGQGQPVPGDLEFWADEAGQGGRGQPAGKRGSVQGKREHKDVRTDEQGQLRDPDQASEGSDGDS